MSHDTLRFLDTATPSITPGPARATHAFGAASEAQRLPPRGTAPAPLERLCARIDATFDALAALADPSHDAAFARGLRAALAEAATAPGLLAPAQRDSGVDGYRRHLLAADPRGRYAVVSLVWRPGQWSPVHGHHTWCGYAVLDGTLNETVYDWNDAARCATQVRSHARATGAVSYVRAGMAGIHRLGHGGEVGAANAVSLHVYGVCAEQIATHVNDVVAVAANVAG